MLFLEPIGSRVLVEDVGRDTHTACAWNTCLCEHFWWGALARVGTGNGTVHMIESAAALCGSGFTLPAAFVFCFSRIPGTNLPANFPRQR